MVGRRAMSQRFESLGVGDSDGDQFGECRESLLGFGWDARAGGECGADRAPQAAAAEDRRADGDTEVEGVETRALFIAIGSDWLSGLEDARGRAAAGQIE